MTRIFHKRRKPIFELIGQCLIFLSVIAAILYGGKWYPAGDVILVATLKGSAVGFLALFVLICARTSNHFILFIALVASVVGDVFLVFPGETSFMKGLGSFLGAQILFILLYLKNRLPLRDVSSFRTGTISLLWAGTGISLYFFYPYLGDKLLPIFVYSITLVTMASTALLSEFPVKLVGIGALLFVISDSLLGAEMFTTMPENTGYFIWGTYYLAELFMTLGVMLLSDRRSFNGGYRFD